MTVLEAVSQDLSLAEYRELAELSHQIRCAQSLTEKHARELGVNAGSYILLLAVQGLPEGARPTIAGLAEQLCMSEESVGAMVDVAVSRNEVIRSSADGNGTQDWVKLTRPGRELLHRVALVNRDELERCGPELVRALQTVLKQRRRRHRGAA